VAKSRSHKKPHAKTKVKHADTGAFSLSLGWVAVESLLGPGAMLVILFIALDRFADASSATAQIAIVGAFVAIRLPLLVYTLARDRRIVLGKDELRIPVVSVFQLRPWRISLDDLVGIEEQRKSGGSGKVVLTLRGGRTRKFPVNVLRDRGSVIKTIERSARGSG
jgi:hypothetical protein